MRSKGSFVNCLLSGPDFFTPFYERVVNGNRRVDFGNKRVFDQNPYLIHPESPHLLLF